MYALASRLFLFRWVSTVRTVRGERSFPESRGPRLWCCAHAGPPAPAKRGVRRRAGCEPPCPEESRGGVSSLFDDGKPSSHMQHRHENRRQSPLDPSWRSEPRRRHRSLKRHSLATKGSLGRDDAQGGSRKSTLGVLYLFLRKSITYPSLGWANDFPCPSYPSGLRHPSRAIGRAPHDVSRHCKKASRVYANEEHLLTVIE